MGYSVRAVDRESIRRTNSALILRALEHRPRSRTSLARHIGLPKSTVGALVAELVDRGLVRECAVDRDGSVGRPQRPVELAGGAVRGVGVEIAADHVYAVTQDLRGTVIDSRCLTLDVTGRPPAETAHAVSGVVAQAMSDAASDRADLIGVTIGTPGFVDRRAGIVHWAPTIGWQEVPLVELVSDALTGTPPPIALHNEAQLATAAEYRSLGEPVGNLLVVTGGYGIGGGVIVNGQDLNDAAGLGPEVGHMPLDPIGRPCPCGRRGCWETQVGLGTLLRLAAGESDPMRDTSIEWSARLAMLHDRIGGGDERAVRALDRVIADFALGLSVLVDMFNPELVVLGGYFAGLADHVLEPVGRLVRARMFAPTHREIEIVASTLGFTAAATGGSRLALAPVFEDPLAHAARTATTSP